MANLVVHRKFVCSDALNNNNKFWEVLFHDDGSATFKYGRVGSTCNEEHRTGLSQKDIDSKIREKLRGKAGKPAYQEIEVVAETMTVKSAGKDVLKAAAEAQLAGGKSELKSLIQRLVEANKHEIQTLSGGKITIDTSSGVIKTPVGIITKKSILEARNHLGELQTFVTKKNFDDPNFIKELNQYLMKVPQLVGHARGWHKYFLADQQSVARQSSLLDQLEASADFAETSVKTQVTSKVEDVFQTELEILTDKKEIDRITKYFLETVNNSHTSKHLRPKNFYIVHNKNTRAAYQADGAKLTNQRELWHGTRVFNVLSILKNGLKLPKAISTMNITGAMFGNGIYGSDQSTKALNYSYGYWDSSAKDRNCFMFLVDFAMGKSYTPKSSYESLPKAGYDSTFAEAKTSGVMNNEMIVYRESQCDIRYLIEFE